MGDARNHCWVYQRRKSFVVKKTKFFFLLFCARGSWLYDQNYLGSKVLHQGTRFIPAREADCRACCDCEYLGMEGATSLVLSNTERLEA